MTRAARSRSRAAARLLEVRRPVRSVIAGASECSSSGTHAPCSVEIGSSRFSINVAGVNKGAALEELSAELGVGAAEVVAFGDYTNDLPMLAWAGTSIAPGNAHPDVLAVVDEITAPNDEDGLALAIERLLPV